MQDRPETPEERLQRRRIRRWKRRARIVAPLLGVPILLAALALSVDLIEYRPQPKRERLSDRPIRIDPKPARPSVPDVPVVSIPGTRVPHVVGTPMTDVGQDDGFEFMLSPPEDAPAPTPPEALGLR